MTETIPAKTVVICDRCRNEIGRQRQIGLTVRDVWHREGFWVSITGRHQGKKLDLCEDCSARFDEFMGSPRELKNEADFAAEEKKHEEFSRYMNDSDRPIGNTD